MNSYYLHFSDRLYQIILPNLKDCGLSEPAKRKLPGRAAQKPSTELVISCFPPTERLDCLEWVMFSTGISAASSLEGSSRLFVCVLGVYSAHVAADVAESRVSSSDPGSTFKNPPESVKNKLFWWFWEQTGFNNPQFCSCQSSHSH